MQLQNLMRLGACVWPGVDRAAKGSWKKSGDRPVGVDWNERVINIHEGGWNYIATGVGIAPGKILLLSNLALP